MCPLREERISKYFKINNALPEAPIFIGYDQLKYKRPYYGLNQKGYEAVEFDHYRKSIG